MITVPDRYLDPAFSYPQGRGNVPADAAHLTDGYGYVWALSTVRAVPTGLYLWGLLGAADDPAHTTNTDPTIFRTRAQISIRYGMGMGMLEPAVRAENAQYLRQVN